MKKLYLLIPIVLTSYAQASPINNSPSTSVLNKFSVHCYFGGNVVLTSEAKRATYLNGTWNIQDIDGSVYETNALCIVKSK